MTSHGLLFVGGLICFVLGAFALYTAPGSPTAPDVAVATPLIVFMATLTAAFMAPRPGDDRPVAATEPRISRAHTGRAGRRRVPPGSDGVVKTALAPLGVVYTVGEDWSARSASGSEIPVRRTGPRGRAGRAYASRRTGGHRIEPSEQQVTT